MADTHPVGSVAWVDLTVGDAESVRSFYERVTGWTHSEVSMGEYSDYAMQRPEDSAAVAGICHSRGVNSDLPTQWLIYIVVDDLDASIACCTELGGKLRVGPKGMGPGARYCVIEDPAGAVTALYEQK